MTSILLLAASLVLADPPHPHHSGWQAGTARVVITPPEPMWMAGYGARDRPSQGKIHDLWAKALAFRDPIGRTAVLVTLDVCGIGPDVSNAVRDAAKTHNGLDRDRIVIACSHTHSGPVIGKNLISMYRLDDSQRRRIEVYTKGLIESLAKLIETSIKALEPAEVAWGTGRTDFAVNRRTNNEQDVPALRDSLALKGPVDHDVPVLRVNTAAGKLKAVVMGYACHCTVLDGYKFSGDYAGFAQVELETTHPGMQAMFVAGCGADQNPLPRRTVELAERYGHQLAEAVDDVLIDSLHAVEGPLATSYEEVPLGFASIPDKSFIEMQTKVDDFTIASRAKMLLRQIEEKGKLDPTYPYPVQVWRLGDLTWIFLGGEVVVDYSLRLKANLGSSRTWVSAYCNDVMAYIPSWRVLLEGGYEGGGAMVYYGLPSPWDGEIEEKIVSAVGRRIKAVAPIKAP